MQGTESNALTGSDGEQRSRASPYFPEVCANIAGHHRRLLAPPLELVKTV